MTEPHHDQRAWQSILTALQLKKRVYHALVTRFVIGRYGRDNIGFMWTIVEPMMLCIGVMAIWSVTKGSDYHGVNVVAFVMTGYMPLTLWRHQTNSMVNYLRYTKFLTIFKEISLFDAMIARLSLEFISVSGAALVVYFTLNVLGWINEPYNWSTLLIGWLAMGAISSGTSILIAALSAKSEIIEKLNQPVQYFLIPFCGCFFMVNWLPDSARDFVLLIPLVHAYEIIRAGFFGPEISTFGSPTYGFACAIVAAGLGCFLFERVKDYIET